MSTLLSLPVLAVLAILIRERMRPRNRYIGPLGKLRRYIARRRLARVCGWARGWSRVRG